MLNRFTNIFWHYYGGPLVGFRQRLWPKERQYSVVAQMLAVVLYLGQLSLFIFGSLSPIPRIGLALILFSPQWLYIYPIPSPVFEFRGYGMAAGVALILAWILNGHPFLIGSLCLFWACSTLVRRQLLTDPLRFWRRADEEKHA